MKYVIRCTLFYKKHAIGLSPRSLKANFIRRKSLNAEELRGNFTISSTEFRVKCFQWGRTMRLEYVIKCRLFIRKCHVKDKVLLWQNGIYRKNAIQARGKLPNVYVVQRLFMFWLDFRLCFHGT